MDTHRVKESKLAKVAVKAMANLAKNVASCSINATSWALLHQPKEPKDLAKRLEAMNKNRLLPVVIRKNRKDCV